MVWVRQEIDFLKNQFNCNFKLLGHDAQDEPRSQMTPGWSTENTSSWMREHNMDADISTYAKAKLLRRDEYFFKIWHHAKKLFK